MTLVVDRFRSVTERSPQFRAIVVHHEQALLAQTQQSAACNASHQIEARLSRWLLRARDLSRSDSISLTQEFLAQMLGVQRSSVSSVDCAGPSFPRKLPALARLEAVAKPIDWPSVPRTISRISCHAEKFRLRSSRATMNCR